MNTRKSLHFDLDYNKLKKYYSETNPGNAYRDIKKYMLSHGFEHHQYSGYVSKYKMSKKEGHYFCSSLSNEFSWLHYCVKNIHMTDVGSVDFDMKKAIFEPYLNDDSFVIDRLVEMDDNYRLFELDDGEYELRDYDDNLIITTYCETIEDALEEFQNQNDLEIN